MNWKTATIIGGTILGTWIGQAFFDHREQASWNVPLFQDAAHEVGFRCRAAYIADPEEFGKEECTAVCAALRTDELTSQCMVGQSYAHRIDTWDGITERRWKQGKGL